MSTPKIQEYLLGFDLVGLESPDPGFEIFAINLESSWFISGFFSLFFPHLLFFSFLKNAEEKVFVSNFPNYFLPSTSVGLPVWMFPRKYCSYVTTGQKDSALITLTYGY